MINCMHIDTLLWSINWIKLWNFCENGKFVFPRVKNFLEIVKMEKIKIAIFVLLQIVLLVVAENVTSTEKHSAKISSREINSSAETSNIILRAIENATAILKLDNSTMESEVNTTTEEIPTSTAPLIPIATVEAQIEKIDVTTKKTRVQFLTGPWVYPPFIKLLIHPKIAKYNHYSLIIIHSLIIHRKINYFIAPFKA